MRRQAIITQLLPFCSKGGARWDCPKTGRSVRHFQSKTDSTVAESCLQMQRRNRKKWVAQVKTDSTHPPAGLFTKNANTIVKTLVSKKVSPKGLGSGMRMLTYFINRAGRGLSAARRAELEKAKSLLSKRVKREQSAHKRKAA
jgi:tRNA(adenine34) deaminase